MGASPQTDRRGLSMLDGGKVEAEPIVAAAVSAALALGADVNAANQTDDTALHAAALLGYDSVIAQLVKAGAKPDMKNARGLTPLGQIEGKTGGAVRSPDRANRGPRESTVELLAHARFSSRSGRLQPADHVRLKADATIDRLSSRDGRRRGPSTGARHRLRRRRARRRRPTRASRGR